MFVFFSNRIGCLGSILVSAIVTVILLLIFARSAVHYLKRSFSREACRENTLDGVETDGPRTLTDARELRALSHPVRLALMEALGGGPLTATQAGELIGETATTCSFHLRQLARYGFVEEAGGGRGRARPWRLTRRGWSAPARPDDPDWTRASQALDRVLLDRYAQRLRRFVDEAPSYPWEWYEAAVGQQHLFHLTPDELAEFAARYEELIGGLTARFHARRTDPAARPAGALPVELLLFGYPVQPPEGSDVDPTAAR
ncbi:helix-turn-helix domain-containing protein [Micromonospora yasonensis]|uniref:ArsR/SmtB family transcription factor n=1 Tax=Micromonospora yasonensis TaxID=1128667 RepID=UPI00223277FA|nr:helix-turn-helix domain-containing protein [Micromonospora yasonensis]MCW3844672.1 helix-turn-helix domain-containing protein [Micromonospora yasonensis]